MPDRPGLSEPRAATQQYYDQALAFFQSLPASTWQNLPAHIFPASTIPQPTTVHYSTLRAIRSGCRSDQRDSDECFAAGTELSGGRPIPARDHRAAQSGGIGFRISERWPDQFNQFRADQRGGFPDNHGDLLRFRYRDVGGNLDGNRRVRGGAVEFQRIPDSESEY